MDNEEECIVCCKPIVSGELSSLLTEKGCLGINKASKVRKCDIRAAPGQRVHQKCRKVFTNTRYIDQLKRKRLSDTPSTSKHPVLRSSSDSFNYEIQCIFCGQGDLRCGRDPESKLIPVRLLSFKESIQESAKKRSDQWGCLVQGRIEYVHDLRAAHAVYHKVCSNNFRTGRDIPHKFYQHDHEASVKRAKRGRPHDVIQMEAFLNVMHELESKDDEQTTVNDLIGKMAELLSEYNIPPYSHTYMKEQIQNNFGDKVIITEANGKPNVVTMWRNATSILQVFHSQAKSVSTQREKDLIISTAAKFLKNDIKLIEQQPDIYPRSTEMISVDEACNFLPNSLQPFLGELFTATDSKMKIASIGQAIVQSTRHRGLLAPLQLGLGIQLHHHFGSKFLVNTLHKFGFTCSYKEIVKFERSAAVNEGTTISNMENSFLQYIADNVDHNLRTIDGLSTFHGMGIMATLTPGITRATSVPRIKVTDEDILSVGQINIHHFMSAIERHCPISYKELKDHDRDHVTKVDLLWDISLSVKSPRPNLSGMMQMINKEGSHPGKSSMIFLPMINLEPGNTDCIYSTLMYVSEHAARCGVTPVLTFDQPLWLKALKIQKSSAQDSIIRSIVLRLGGFHIQMSYLGSIGYIMSGSGLTELLELIYASNTVPHMLSGKAIARAVRGHFLVCSALHMLLISKVYGTKLPKASKNSDEDENVPDKDETLPDILKDITCIYNDVMNCNIAIKDVETSPTMELIANQFDLAKNDLKKSRTSKLWLQYLDMIALLQAFLRAERTGNWQMHLTVLREMLPFLAAAGHNHYTKSLYLYLQEMDELEIKHPEVYQHFMEGFHVARRSDRYWGGLSPDLISEQVLMRSLKASGGLTHGRGMGEIQRLIWLLSSIVTSEINLAMQELSGVSYETSDQHKDISVTRMEKDLSDVHQMVYYLSERNPFTGNCELYSLSTGVMANEYVNADQALLIGKKVLEQMPGKNIEKHKFKKKEQVIPLSNHNAVKIKGDVINISPQLLFQRLVTAGTINDNLFEVFEYELCNYPPSLFENRTTLRLATKSALADALWKLMPPDTTSPSGNVQYVLDGGALLHRITWRLGTTYAEICKDYVNYVLSHYGKAMIVFDGYPEGPTTKDVAHQRRQMKHASASVHVSDIMIFQGKKVDFLSNMVNKQRFIHLLADHLSQIGCYVVHAQADADLLIVQTAIDAANKDLTQPTVVVADDTDILILLCWHLPPTTPSVYFRPESHPGTKKTPKCWNIAVMKEVLDQNLCNNILFVHAMLGCDTTSALYGVGKIIGLNLITTNKVFLEQAQVFSNPNATPTDVITAGEKALIQIYKGNSDDSLNFLRLQRFHQKVSKSTSPVQPEVLPPSSSAAKYHSLRVYLQVQEWKGRTDLLPENWGWYKQGNKFLPILTDKQAAPEALLQIIRCNCKASCTSAHCTCRKNGLECSTGCGHCRGLCTNVLIIEESDTLNELP